MQEDIAENIYSDDFESDRSGKKIINLSQKSESMKNSGNYRANLTNFNAKFPHSDSLSSSLSSPHKISARSNRKSPDLRSSTSSISEDIDIYDSFSKQSANFEHSIRRSISYQDSSKQIKPDNASESLYSEDFESESKSFKPSQSYGSDFESISHSDTKNLKQLQHSIKEESPEESNSASDSLHTENEIVYSAEAESRSNSVILKNVREEIKEMQPEDQRESPDFEQEDLENIDSEIAMADEVTEMLFEILKEDALLLLCDRDVSEIVEELYREIIQDSLRLVPYQKIYPNNPNYLTMTSERLLSELPDAQPPTGLKILNSYQKDIPITSLAFNNFQDFIPNSAPDFKKVFRSTNKAITDSINEIYTKCNASIFSTSKPTYNKDSIKVKIQKLLNRKMGLIKSCITQEDRRQLDIQRETSIKEAVYEEIEEENPEWLNLEAKEIQIVCSLEDRIIDELILEIQYLL